MLGWLTERRRRHLLAQPYPAAWDGILADNVHVFARLEAADQARLRDLTRVFVAEKRWEGCGGLEITETVQVTIAAQACLLLLGLDHALYADVETLLVYPSTVVLPTRTPGVFERGGAVLEPGAPILGQAFRGGPVLLAWDQVLAGGREQRPGHNVVFHELAHKIDMLDGPVDGTPPLADARTRRTWAEVCSAAFLALRDAVERGERGALDAYAATNEAEFFAVATEAYFTRPAKLARDLPALHRVLVDFYRFTPPEA